MNAKKVEVEITENDIKKWIEDNFKFEIKEILECRMFGEKRGNHRLVVEFEPK